MSNFEKFDSKTTLNISEGYDLRNQEHYVNKKCGLCDCFHKTCSFRVWKVLVFLLVVAAIMTVMGLLIAMFGPGNTDLRYSEKESRVAPTVVKNEGDKHTSSEGISTTGEPGTGTVEPTKPQSTSRPSESSPCTQPTTPPDEKTPLKCEVAIVGGGTGGLILAYALLKGLNPKETDVCIFEKENRLGGKILDHRFAEAPNVTVGLGEWYRPGLSYGLSDTLSELTIDNRLSWKPKVSRVEARGVYAKDFDSLELKAFPTLSDNPLMSNATIKKTAKDLQNKNANNFSTAGTFLSGYLSPEGAKLMEDVYGFKGGYMQAINPKSYKKYLKETVDEDDTDEDERPPRGMSQMIEQLDLKVRHFNGTIFLQEAVTSISKKGDKFVLLTTNFTVEAKKAVLAVEPPALKKLSGDVIQSIISHDIFKSIVSVPAFSGAAVYPTAWWNDSVAAQKNNSLEPMQQFVSSSHCLGITMPYKGTGPNGTAVLHTVANNGGCSDMWGNILKVSKDAVDREMKRALEYKFQRTIPVEPLATVYKYWEEGYWYFQKPGSSFSLTEIKDWAKRPLTGNDVFLVGRAFHNFGGWLEDTIRSADEALNEGWKFRMSWL